MEAQEHTAISAVLHPPKVTNDFLMKFIPFLNVENLFHDINNLHQNIKFTMEEESNEELAFLDTLLKQNNEKISLLVYRKLMHTDQY